jgi:hypothetical protein
MSTQDDSKKPAEKPESKKQTSEDLKEEQLERISGGALSYAYHSEF